jgi:hypothetical protein
VGFVKRERSHTAVNRHLPELRPAARGNDADGCLSVFLRVHGLQNFASAQGGRLLCVLFLWHGRVPTHSRTARLLSLVSSANTAMLFTKKLRARVTSGEVTASVRIWKNPRVKAGGKYRLEQGHIEVTSIREIAWEDLTDKLARDTGFKNLIDMMKTAKHGMGSHIYYVRFEYRAGSARPVTTRRKK